MEPRVTTLGSHRFRVHTEGRTAAYLFLFVWFLGAAVPSWLGWLRNVPSAVLFFNGAAIPVSVFFIAYFTSDRFRRIILAQNLRQLTLIQVSRATGFIFFIEAGRRLPEAFAVPTGFTDVTVGVTAPLAGFLLISQFGSPEPGLAGWHVFGMLAE